MKTKFLYAYLFFALCAFCSCGDDEDDIVDDGIVDMVYHVLGSEDLISVYDITVTYPTPTGKIQEIVQLPWERTVKNVPLPILSDSITWKCSPKSNYPKKDSYNLTLEMWDDYIWKDKYYDRSPQRVSFHYPDSAIYILVGTYIYSLYN
jgi:hypothetical protein